MKLVSRNTIASTKSTIPRVPVITFPKYKPAMIKAMIVRIVLSAEPMFFFMIVCFKFIQI